MKGDDIFVLDVEIIEVLHSQPGWENPQFQIGEGDFLIQAFVYFPVNIIFKAEISAYEDKKYKKKPMRSFTFFDTGVYSLLISSLSPSL